MENDFKEILDCRCNLNDDTKKKICEAYEQCKKYLDRNFLKEFRGNSFEQRLFELYVCNKILNSPYKDKLKHTSKKNHGPDFRIENIVDNKDLFIECVCPTEGSGIIDDSDYEITKCEHGSILASGSSKTVIARITSAIKDKSEKFRDYFDKKIIKESDIKILCIDGYPLQIVKGKHTGMPIPIHVEFKEAIRGKEYHRIGQEDGDVSGSFYKEDCFEKQNSTKEQVSYGDGTKFQDDCVAIFDAIILCQNFPFHKGVEFYFACDKNTYQSTIKIFNKIEDDGNI